MGCDEDEVDVGLSDGAVFLDSRSVISTGVEAGTSSCDRVVWGTSCGEAFWSAAVNAGWSDMVEIYEID